RIAIGYDEPFRSSAAVGTGMAKLGVETQIEKGGRTYVYSPEPMPVAVDLDGDGIDEIVVPQNQIPGRLAVVYKGPAGYRFQTVNSGFEGSVMALGAVPCDGTPSLVAPVVRYTNFRNTQGETQIITNTPQRPRHASVRQPDLVAGPHMISRHSTALMRTGSLVFVRSETRA